MEEVKKDQGSGDGAGAAGAAIVKPDTAYKPTAANKAAAATKSAQDLKNAMMKKKKAKDAV